MKRADGEPTGLRLRFTQSGVSWLAAAVLIGALAWYKSINLVLIVVYAMGCLLVLNGLLAWNAVRKSTARRLSLPPVFAGERVECGLTVTSSAAYPITLTAEDRAGPGANSFLVYRLPPGHALPCTAWRTFPTRGRYGGPVTLTSGFPFGFITCECPGAADGEIVVLPSIGVADPDGLRRWVLRSAQGDDRARRVLRRVSTDQAEVRGVRPYRSGDAIRDMHWRTTARRGEPMVREYDTAPSPELVLVIEAWLPSVSSAVDRTRLEAALSLAATIAVTWRRAFDSAVTVVVPGPDAVATTATSEENLRAALAPLASIQGTDALVAPAAQTFTRHLARGARLVVSSRANSPLAAALEHSTGKPFVTVCPSDRPLWYQPPVSV